jgi:hypothetical protein
VSRPLLSFLALTLLSACTPAAGQEGRRAPVVHIRRVDAHRANAVGRTAGVEGDYVVRGGALRLLVGGPGRHAKDRGRVLALQANGTGSSDDLDFIAPVVIVGERSYEVRTRELSIARVAGRPALRIAGTFRRGGRDIAVERLLTIADTKATLTIYTRVGDAGAPVSIAERVAWGGQPPFAAWVGAPADAEWHDTDWIATQGPRRSIALGFRGGRARVRAELEHERGQSILRSTLLAVPAPSDGSPVRTLVSVSSGELAGAVRRLGWARGRPFPEAAVVLSHVPSDAAVRLADGRGKLWLESGVAARRVPVPLPHGATDIVAHATAFGHAASEDMPLAPGGVARLSLPRSGRLTVSTVDDESGEAIPFRIRVARLGQTPHPDLGPIWSAAGARDVAVSLGRPLSVSLPTGVYEVFVMHGPEWSIERSRVVVTGVGVTEVSARLRREVDAGAWIPCDFHLHAEPSPDSHVTLGDRVTALVAEGVRFAVATDHNHVTDYAPIVRELDVRLGTVHGVEVTTEQPAFGHFNAFPFPLDPSLPGNGAPEFMGLTPARLFASLRAASEGVIVQVNHPRFEGGIGYFDETSFDPAAGTGADTYSDDYDAIEVWNGYEQARPDRVERNIAEWIAMLARGRRVVATGNSDSHNVRNELAGYPRTYVWADAFDPLAAPAIPESAADAGVPAPDGSTPSIDGGTTDAGVLPAGAPRVVPLSTSASGVLDGLRAGRAFVTNGPLLDVRAGDRGPGEHLEHGSGSLRVELRVFAPSWMSVDAIDVYVGREIAQTIAIEPMRARRGDPPGLRFQRRIEVEAAGPTFIVAVVRGEEPMDAFFTRRGVRPLAFTNPIWIDPAP